MESKQPGKTLHPLAVSPVVEASSEPGISENELGEVTRDILTTGIWKSRAFRPSNIFAPPIRLVSGRRNPYSQFIEGVKNKLASLGFEEVDGDLTETGFWNSDALFMPQVRFLPENDDTFSIKDPVRAKKSEEPFLSQVAEVHENGGMTGSRGWNYQFDADFSKHLVLRSRGTGLSARTLTSASIPGKYFGIVRCFRRDKMDDAPRSDLFEAEGIILGEDVTVRTLLGLLKMLATEVAGAVEITFVPGYFPFTEPTVEVHVKHPSLGWYKLGGAGIFRSEVTEPLGVKVPVLSWNIDIEKMALMAFGLSENHELFSPDLGKVRLRRNKT